MKSYEVALYSIFPKAGKHFLKSVRFLKKQAFSHQNSYPFEPSRKLLTASKTKGAHIKLDTDPLFATNFFDALLD